MPGFDGTGPFGKGPMTGRGMGFCVLKESGKNTGALRGFAGAQGRPLTSNYYPMRYRYFYYFLPIRFRRFFRLRNFRRVLGRGRFTF